MAETTELGFDALDREYLFCMWPGKDQLPKERAAELFSIISSSDSAVVYLNDLSYGKWEIPEAPFHPALKYLSECHRSDYLRVYLMHYYGGGYTDIKFTYKSWKGAFKTLKQSDAYVLGYKPKKIGMSEKYQDPVFLKEIEEKYLPFGIGHVAFIFKRQTPLTLHILNRLHKHLDEYQGQLMANPSRTQKDWLGKILDDGSTSKYPLHYTELGPDLFHLSLYRFKDKIIHYDIEPIHIFSKPIAAPGFANWKKQFSLEYIPQWPFSA
ncbi:MAG: hypothetical protein FJY58_09500 [Betaproteobacteria bacterium]|nr:hypothetical protein [Betaproteobacteria bacterium]